MLLNMKWSNIEKCNWNWCSNNVIDDDLVKKIFLKENDYIQPTFLYFLTNASRYNYIYIYIFLIFNNKPKTKWITRIRETTLG